MKSSKKSKVKNKLHILVIGNSPRSRQLAAELISSSSTLVCSSQIPREQRLEHFDLILAGSKAILEKLRSRCIASTLITQKTTAKNILGWYLPFRAFVLGLAKHRNGYPYIVLAQNKLAVAFMSIDLPKKIGAHILVIPKRRYEFFSDIPRAAMTDMMLLVQKIGPAIEKKYDGYNILLNNGAAAGQAVKHAHIHIIPRYKKDGIKIEAWKKNHAPITQFIAANKKIKRLIKI